MTRLAIIPARGGSKRIPRKNIRLFSGKPIISFAIEAALESGIFDEVMVSTDDTEIADIAIAQGAKVPFYRSKENSDDQSTTVSVLLEVLRDYEKMQKHFDLICCIYPANPFLTARKLSEALFRLENSDFDSVFSAVKYSSPVQRSFFIDDGKIRMLFPEFIGSRSQDLMPVFHDAAQFYWLRSKTLVETKKIWTDNTGIVEIPEIEVQDIDTVFDWELAELKYSLWTKRNIG